MRKSIVLIAFMCCFSVFGQTSTQKELPITATTLKEYNYLTKGLKIQLESGLDIIDGYTLIRGAKLTVGNYTFASQYLQKKSEGLIKAMSIIIYSEIAKKNYFICVPYHNDALNNDYWKSINLFDEQLSKSYAYFMSTLFIDCKAVSYSAMAK